jgi:hypothetical protein
MKNTNEIPQGEIDQLVAEIDQIKNVGVLPRVKREELVEDLRSGVNCLICPEFPNKINTFQIIKNRIAEVLSLSGPPPRLAPEGQAA